MNNRKKKPSVFKNIMIITGCTMFAAVYAMIFVYWFTGSSDDKETVSTSVAQAEAEEFETETMPELATQQESLPAWIDRVEIEIASETESESETEVETETKAVAETDSSGTIGQEPRFAEEPEGLKKETAEAIEETETWTFEEKKTEEDGKTKKSSIQVGNVQTVQQAGTAKAVVTDVTEVVKAAMPCVVAITNEYTAYDYWYGEEYDEEASGSGIIISQNDGELLILTNYHVVEDANDLYVQFIDNTEVMAYAKGVAPDEDLAVVSVFLEDVPDETLEKIAIAALGDSDALEVGEPSIAIGNSLGYGQSVTTGVVSALDCNIFEDDEDISLTSLIQTDAAINPGNSGGALLNVSGEVIGINSSKIADYAIEGMGYAIPINTAKPIVDELVKKETKRKAASEERAFLGISGTDVSEEAVVKYEMSEGVYVSGVLENTAAAKAGIKKGDIITAIDDERVTSMNRLQGILEYYAAGTSAEVTFMRIQDDGYEKKTVKVTFGLKQD